MIHFKRVWKRFSNDQVVIQDLTLEIQEGETLVILGKSGSGKTTALKLINRLIDPSAGVVEVRGEDIQNLDPIQLRRSIGYAVQEIGLFPHMTVEENIAVVPKLLRWDEKRIRNRTMQLMEILGLDPNEYLQRYPLSLSGGQRQRIGVARALAADPPIILMDEPFGALDPITREKIQNEFLELESKIKKTVVFVTHDLFEAVTMGDRIALMDQGKLLEVATPRRFVENPPSSFSDAFLGQHRFQLSLLTKTIVKCMEPSMQRVSKSKAMLTPKTTLMEALNTFKEEKVATLPVLGETSFRGVLKKERLIDEILDLLLKEPRKREASCR